MSGWTTGNGGSTGNSGYSSQDIMKMQKEAEERVREMQERSRRVLEENPPVYPDFVRKPGSPHSKEPLREKSGHGLSEVRPIPAAEIPGQKAQPLPHQPIIHPQEHSTGKPSGLLDALGGTLGGLLRGGGEGPISRVMDALGIDNDKIIVLALLLILLNNNADKKLILALCYILL